MWSLSLLKREKEKERGSVCVCVCSLVPRLFPVFLHREEPGYEAVCVCVGLLFCLQPYIVVFNKSI